MRKAIILIGTLIVLLCLVGCGQQSTATEEPPTWQEQYDLGVRYLSEGNYEEAIIAFTAAIEIDPKRPEAYLAAAEAYVAQGDMENAQNILESGLSATGDSNIEEQLSQLHSNEETEQLLGNILPFFAADDLEAAKEIMLQAEYIELVESLKEGFYFVGGDGNLGLAVYPEGYYYYGEWEGDQRSGTGIWFRAVYPEDDSLESYLYRGSWANDRPNGEGSILRIASLEKLELEPGHTTSIRTEISGTFKDGLYHGTIYEVWNMNDGGVHIWSPITAVDGIYQQMENIPQEVQGREYYQSQIAVGGYLVAMDTGNERSDLWNYGDVNAVQGFAP